MTRALGLLCCLAIAAIVWGCLYDAPRLLEEWHALPLLFRLVFGGAAFVALLAMGLTKGGRGD